jgi:hypothetical protein
VTLPNSSVAAYTHDATSRVTGITYMQVATTIGTLTHGEPRGQERQSRLHPIGTMFRFLPIAMLLFFGMLGCQNVKSIDVIGTCVVSDESRQRFFSAAQQKASAKIVLDANGSFVASEVPEDLLYRPPAADAGFVTGSGVWRLFSREGRKQVQLEFRAITVGQRGNVPYGTHLNISGGSSDVSLYYFQGDPDQARRIEFDRK